MQPDVKVQAVVRTSTRTLAARSRSLIALVLGVSALPAWTEAQDTAADDSIPLGSFQVNDADPESSVPTREEANKHPLDMGYLMMSLSERGDEATKRGDHAKAAHYYLALAKGTPDVAAGFSRACEAFAKAGDVNSATAACHDALARTGVKTTDYLRYAGLALQQPAALTGERLSDLEAVITQMQEKIGGTEQGLRTVTSMKCQLAVRLDDVTRLAGCVDAVKGYAPNDTEALVYRSLFALKQERWDDAEKLIADGEKAGVPADVIKRSKESLEGQRAWAREQWRGEYFPIGGLVGVGTALVLALWWFAAGRRRALKTSTPAEA